MTNADPRALRLFIRWITRFHGADPKLVLALHLHEGNDDHTARVWWTRALDLTDAEFTQTFVKPAGTGHRKNHFPHGVCRGGLRRSANAWHATMAWIGVIAEPR
jgi:hypothetical protein